MTKYLSGVRRIWAAFKYKGFRYAWNYLHFHLFWYTRHPLITKILYLLDSYPQYLEVEVTTRCNLRCIQCEHTYWHEPGIDMPFDKFKHIIDQFPRLKWIGLTGIGESFMHKDFLNMLEYVKKKHAIVELFDTFYFIDETVARRLIEINIENFFVSLDGATKETYEALRVGSDFKRVTENVRTFFRIKKEMGSFFPEMNFHYIINKLNCGEVSRYVELVAELSGARPSGGDDVTIFFSQMLHRFKESDELFIKVPEETIAEAIEAGKRHGVKITWNPDVPTDKPPMNNCVEWTMPFIFATGDVIPCCSGNEANRRDFQRETALGNIFTQSFKEIWRGQRYKNLKTMLKTGQCPPPCSNCCVYKSCSS
ncbi:MAG: SPASM domain-containing protein [Nitrospirae bacterium]|nr:SPASM domain-containing protein [Nitrospirota bacterium]